MKSYSFIKWGSFILCCFIYPLTHFHRYFPSALAPDLSKALNVSVAEVGYFSSMYFYSYGIMQPVVGMLSDVINPGFVIGYGAILTSIGAVIMTLTSSFYLASCGRILVGFGVAANYVSIGRFISNWFNPKKYTLMNSLLLMIGGFGGLASQRTLISFANLVGWKNAMRIISLYGFIMGILAILYVKGSPTEYGFEIIEGTSEPPKFEKISEMLIDIKNNLLEVSRLPIFWVHGISVFLAPSACQNVAGMWAVPFLMDVYKFTKEQATSISSVLLLVYIIGSPFLGFISYKTNMKKSLFAICLFIALIICILFIIYTSSFSILMLNILFFLFGVMTCGTASITLPIFVEMVKHEAAGTSLGCGNMWSMIGSGISQSLTAKLLSGYGKSPYSPVAYRYSLWFLCFISIFISFISNFIHYLLLKKNEKSTEKSTLKNLI